MSLLPQDDGRAGILTKRQHAGAGHIGVLEHGQRDHAIVVRRLGVVQDSSHLLQVRRAQEEIDVVKRLRGQQRECLRFHAQHVMTFPGFHRDVFFRQQSVLSVVRSKFKQFLVVERNGWHGITPLVSVKD